MQWSFGISTLSRSSLIVLTTPSRIVYFSGLFLGKLLIAFSSCACFMSSTHSLLFGSSSGSANKQIRGAYLFFPPFVHSNSWFSFSSAEDQDDDESLLVSEAGLRDSMSADVLDAPGTGVCPSRTLVRTFAIVPFSGSRRYTRWEILMLYGLFGLLSFGPLKLLAISSMPKLTPALPVLWLCIFAQHPLGFGWRTLLCTRCLIYRNGLASLQSDRRRVRLDAQFEFWVE